MLYIVYNPVVGNVFVDLPFTDIVGAKRQFQDIEQGQRVYVNLVSYQALITSASCIQSILNKSASLEEEKRQLALPGQVDNSFELLAYLNNKGMIATGENRQAYNIMEQAKQANKQKLEKAYREIKSIINSVNYLARKYEYLYIETEKAFSDVDRYISLYIDRKISLCSQDTQDFYSDTKTALFTANCNCSDEYRQVEKAGYKALNAYIYDFKKTDVHYCLDDENQTISINAMMKAMELNGQGNITLRKAFNSAFKYLSSDERKVALCIGYGYSLEYIASLLNKSISTVFTYWKKAKGKLARLIPASALKCNIKPIELYQARKELQGIQEQEQQEQKEKNREKQKAYRERQKASATDEQKALAREKNRERQKAYRERQKALATV